MTTSSPTILLRRSQIAKLAGTRDYLACMRSAFMDLAQARYAVATVGHIEGDGGVVHLKAAKRAGVQPRLVVKMNANYPGNVAHGLPTIQGFIALLDAETGALLALVDTIEITARRTAAATALAATYLARADSAVLGVIGCGTQARYHLEALTDVLPIREVRFCDRRPEAAETFSHTIEAAGLHGVRMPEPEAVASNADVVVTLTTSTTPLLRAANVRQGTFVAGVGADNPSKNELGADLLRASRVVVDVLTQACSMGDLHHAIRAGALSAADIHGDLSGLVAGMIAGRSDDSQRFVFDSTGVAVQDLAAAEMVYARAVAVGDVETIVFNDVWPGAAARRDHMLG